MTNLSNSIFESLLVTEGYLPVIYSDQKGIPTFGLGYALVVKSTKGKWEIRSSLDNIIKLFTETISADDLKAKLQKAADKLNGVEGGKKCTSAIRPIMFQTN